MNLTIMQLTNQRNSFLLSLGVLFFLSVCSPSNAEGQSLGPVEMLSSQDHFERYFYMQSSETDFATIQSHMEDFYSTRDKGKGSGYKQWKRWEYDNSSRLGADGNIMNYKAALHQNIKAYGRTFPSGRYNRSVAGAWNFIGPSSFGAGPSLYGHGLGRVDEVAFHPTDPDIIFVGAPTGGLWKTTDGGNTWVTLTDDLPTISISGIAIDPGNPDRIFINTGDSDSNTDHSLGVFSSTDGGASWEPTGLTFGPFSNSRGGKIIMDPTDNDVLLALQGLNGVFRTDNGGDTWTETYSTSSLYDIEWHPDNPQIVYLSGYNEFLRSDNGGLSWSSVSGLPANTSRIEIAVSPDAPEHVYLMTSNPTGAGTFEGMYFSDDAGLTFSQRATSPNVLDASLDGSGPFAPAATIHLAFAARPSNASISVMGNLNLWKSSDSGLSFSRTSDGYHVPGESPQPDFVHLDIHGLEYNPLNDKLYAATDGGLYVSDNDGLSWTPMTNGLNTTMYYEIADYDPDPSMIIGGTQDNGNILISGDQEIISLYTGDGTGCAIDPTDPQIMYYSAQDGNLQKSITGGESHFQIHPPTGPFIFNMAIDPIDHMKIYGGYYNLEISPDGGATWDITSMPCAVGLDISPVDPDRIYTIGQNTVHTSDDGALTHSDISAGLPTGSKTAIAVDPFDPLVAYITIGSFWFEGSSVFRTDDAGANWEDITGSLPNVHPNCIAFDPRSTGPSGKVYIGSDAGVYYRDDVLGDWVSFNEGLPVVRVEDIEVNEQSGQLTIGTYGRGLWQSDLYQIESPCQPTSFTADPSSCLLVDGFNDPFVSFNFGLTPGCMAESLVILDSFGGQIILDISSSEIVDGGTFLLAVEAGLEFDAFFTVGDESSETVSVTIDPCPGCGNPYAVNYDPQAISQESMCEYDYTVCDCEGNEHSAGVRIWHGDGVLDDGGYFWDDDLVFFYCPLWGYDCELTDPTPDDDPYNTCGGELPPNNGCTECPGDINGDLIVNTADFLSFNSAFGMICAECPQDLNGDGEVDTDDFLILNSNFFNDCAGDVLISSGDGLALDKSLEEFLNDHKDLDIHAELRSKIQELKQSDSSPRLYRSDGNFFSLKMQDVRGRSVTLSIFDLNGKLLSSFELVKEATQGEKVVRFDQTLAKGYYIVTQQSGMIRRIDRLLVD